MVSTAESTIYTSVTPDFFRQPASLCRDALWSFMGSKWLCAHNCGTADHVPLTRPGWQDTQGNSDEYFLFSNLSVFVFPICSWQCICICICISRFHFGVVRRQRDWTSWGSIGRSSRCRSTGPRVGNSISNGGLLTRITQDTHACYGDTAGHNSPSYPFGRISQPLGTQGQRHTRVLVFPIF